MRNLFGVFSDPYPLEEDHKKQLTTSLLVSVFVVGFLILFRPFGLSEITWPWAKQVPVFIGYGAVTFLVLLLADRVIRPAFPTIFDDRDWTVGKNIIWALITIVLIGLGNLFYSSFLGFTGISGTMLLIFQLYTLLVALFPVTILTLLTRIKLLRRNLDEVRQINEELTKPILPATHQSFLVFSSENGKDEVRLSPEKFLYAESADNYTDIVYIENKIVKRELLRSSLKRLEDMNTVDFILRVHRTYLVNLRNVKSVTGNSQGYRLHFGENIESVPVARRSSSLVRELLARIHGN